MTPEERAAAVKLAAQENAMYHKANLKVADLPDDALVDLYNDCVAVLASIKPPEPT